MNLRISQGQATRSTFTFSRVTHFITILLCPTTRRLLYPLQMRMLTASHSFVFSALQGPLIALPRVENCKVLAGRNGNRLDYVLGLEPAGLTLALPTCT